MPIAPERSTPLPRFRRDYADGGGGQIHFGGAGSGEALLMFVGAPRSIKLVEPLCLRLAGSFHVIAVDMPGFGASDPMPADASMEEIGDAIVAVLDRLHIERAHLFGFHTGAKVAAALASRHPDRTLSLIVAGKTHSIIPDRDQRNVAMRAIVADRYFRGGAGPLVGAEPGAAWAALWRMVSNLWWSDALHRSANQSAALCAMADKICDSIAAHDTVFASYDANFAFDLAAAIAKVAAPVHVIEYTSDAEDAALGRQGATLAKLAARGEYHTLPDVDATGLALHVELEALATLIISISAQAGVLPHVEFPLNVYDLKDKVAIVTGGASGLGLGAVRLFLKSGAKVAIWDRDVSAASHEFDAGEAVRTFPTNVADYASVCAAAAATLDAYGPADILVNGAGINRPTQDIAEASLKDWDDILAVDLTGVFYCCRAVIPQMIVRKRGRVVNVASVAGKEGNARAYAYSAAKAGVIAMTKSLGKELGKHNIIVNAIAPTIIDTPMNRQSSEADPRMMERILALIALNRRGTIDEFAAMVAWMSSDDCSFTTGSTFDLSGGRTTY